MTEIAEIAVSLIPVLTFLAGLILLDSYKLIKLQTVLLTIIVGMVVAVVCLIANNFLLTLPDLRLAVFTRYVAPVIEEVVKSLFIIYLIRRHRVGFMVDAAIQGFAIGAGFALVENISFWWALEGSNPMLWVVRGFGTAAVHGGTMAMFGIVSQNLSERKDTWGPAVFLPGLGGAIVLHSLFNHFILPPLVSTVVVLGIFSALVIIVYHYSERATRRWLGHGLDADMKLLEAITTGRILDSRIGRYLESLNDRFPVTVVADMLGLLRVHLELALRAKGLLLMQKASLTPPEDSEIDEKFTELKQYRKNIGRTGMLALTPYLQTSSRDLWQMYLLHRR
ncbi:MAG: PrsW family glutamic-type intramembrane protease [bacterium]